LEIRLLIDMDEVICDFLGPLCRQYNLLSRTQLSISNIDQYDLTNFIGPDGKKIFLRAGFFDCLEPFPGSLDILQTLREDGHDIIIATNALGNPDVAADKCRWIKRYLPEFYPDSFFIASRKHLIRADIIFDDSPDVLNRFPGTRVVMDRPYNRKVEGYRIYNNNWLDFYKLVNSLSFESKE